MSSEAYSQELSGYTVIKHYLQISGSKLGLVSFATFATCASCICEKRSCRVMPDDGKLFSGGEKESFISV